MPSNIDTLVTVFGGSGFIGRHMVRALAKRDFRSASRCGGPISRAICSRSAASARSCRCRRICVTGLGRGRGARRAVVVNLVGILAESGAQTFDAVQAEGAAAVAQAPPRRARASSSVGHRRRREFRSASPHQGGRREGGVRRGALRHGVSPSVVFGPEDQFTNRFAALARMLPVLPLIGGGETKLQPVFVGDVATAIADAVEGKARPGRDLRARRAGSEDVPGADGIRAEDDRAPRLLVPLPFGLARMQATVLQFAPGPLKLTPDQVELLRSDNVVSQAAKNAGLTLQGLGIAPAALEEIVPSYLWRFRRTGQFRTKAA